MLFYQKLMGASPPWRTSWLTRKLSVKRNWIAAVIVALNVWLVPRYGYLASAWASVAGYGVITLLSYFIGQRKYPIRYDVRGMAVYLLMAGVLYAASVGIGQAGLPVAVRLLLNTVLLLLFVAYLVKKDLSLKQLPYVGRFFK